MNLKRISLIALFVLLGLSLALNKDFLKSEAFKAYSSDEQNTIRTALKIDVVRTFLDEHPDWSASTYLEEGSDTEWHIDFYEYDEWIGEAHLDTASGEVYKTYLPLELSEEALAAGKKQIETLVYADAEVLARLGNPADWGSDIYYDMYEQVWTMFFWSGHKSLGVKFYQEENGRFRIDTLFDPDALEGEEAEQHQRDQAVNIAYSVEGIDRVLSGIDDWQTYSESQGGPLWTVEFAAEGKRLITVLVDIEAETVLETELP